MIYRFPKEDCEILEIENVSAEELARLLSKKIEEKITIENLKEHRIFFEFYKGFLKGFILKYRRNQENEGFGL